jgi:ParB family transcriptional regulator, chromosome partitioning protein
MHYVKTFSQRMAEGEELKSIESERAWQRQGSRTDIKETFPECSKRQARDKVADQIGLGSD